MTHKQQATEIFERFKLFQPTSVYDISHKSKDVRAKQCAIVYVKGLIDSCPSAPIPDDLVLMPSDKIIFATAYWKEVLKELEML